MKKFTKKELWAIHNIKSITEFFTSRVVIKTTVILLCIVIIIIVGKRAWSFATEAWKNLGKQVTKIASQQAWEPLVMDEFWNINIMIAWYAWERERWWFLTDTIMLASFNPKEWSVTFLSVPRDLYVAYWNGASGKINSLYWAAYLENNKSHAAASMALANKVWEITGIDIPYYAVISFEGFVDFIDSIKWIDINVPYTLHDEQFPGINDSYEIFHIDQWRQTFDWKKALKYARSRKSTSDFSRALRQQQIIESIIKKLTSSLNIWKIMDTYENLDTIVKTNISGKQILRMGQFIDLEKHFFSFVYTAECDLRYIDLAEPWCVLRYGDRELFNNLSVIIPEWAGLSNLSYYKKTQDFAFRVIHNQAFLKENAPIRVLNAIDTDTARAQGYRINGVATQLWIDLILKWFNVEKVTNDKDVYEDTFLVVPWDWRFPETVEILSAFVDYTAVVSDPSYWSGVSIILGDDFLKKL